MKLPPTFSCTLYDDPGIDRDRDELTRRRELVKRMLRGGRVGWPTTRLPRESLVNRIREYLWNKGEHIVNTEICPNRQGTAEWSCGCRVALGAPMERWRDDSRQDLYVTSCDKHYGAFHYQPIVEYISDHGSE